MRRVVLLAVLVTSAVGCAGGESSPRPTPRPTAELDAFILETLEAAHFAGLSAAVVRDGEIVWTGEYGWRNVADALPVTPQTQFETASISKTIVCATVLQLWEQGLLDLDADIDTYLPISIRNPAHPSTPITMRQLLVHTSSISDEGMPDELYTADADA